MRKWYNQGHVYIVASETDGTPNTALEAAACGRPIISNYVGNMPEFIKDGWNGFLIKGNHSDPGQMSKQYREKMNFLKRNPEKCREMGRNARKTVVENWTWEHSMKHEREALRKLLK
jgi:glycosyltransferase involved in cell wall biosynthesis